MPEPHESPNPNPGSPQAKMEGCRCPVMDNAHGRGAFLDPDTREPQFWITEGCPLHDAKRHSR